MDTKTKIDDTSTSAKRESANGMSNVQRIILLVIGDALVFLIFAAIGRRSHNEAVGLSAFLETTLTAIPFAAGWFIVSPFIGAFRRGLEMHPRAMVQRTLLAWLAAWPVCMVLRGIFVDHGIPPLTFAIITLIANTVLLLVWRWPFSLFNSFKKRQAA